MEISSTKKTQIWQSLNLESRADAFILCNWVVFARPDSRTTDITFGSFNGDTVNPQLVQVSLKINF